jgi:hypothetical protein
MKEFNRIQAFYFTASAVASMTMYFHSTFASSKRVEALEDQITTIHDIVCSIAIEQRLRKSEDACARNRK